MTTWPEHPVLSLRQTHLGATHESVTDATYRNWRSDCLHLKPTQPLSSPAQQIYPTQHISAPPQLCHPIQRRRANARRGYRPGSEDGSERAKQSETEPETERTTGREEEKEQQEDRETKGERDRPHTPFRHCDALPWSGCPGSPGADEARGARDSRRHGHREIGVAQTPPGLPLPLLLSPSPAASPQGVRRCRASSP